MKRSTLHLNTEDMRALEHLAKEESTRTGSTITAAAIVRRLIREHLAKHKAKAGK